MDSLITSDDMEKINSLKGQYEKIIEQEKKIMEADKHVGDIKNIMVEYQRMRNSFSGNEKALLGRNSRLIQESRSESMDFYATDKAAFSKLKEDVAGQLRSLNMDISLLEIEGDKEGKLPGLEEKRERLLSLQKRLLEREEKMEEGYQNLVHPNKYRNTTQEIENMYVKQRVGYLRMAWENFKRPFRAFNNMHPMWKVAIVGAGVLWGPGIVAALPSISVVLPSVATIGAVGSFLGSTALSAVTGIASILGTKGLIFTGLMTPMAIRGIRKLHENLFRDARIKKLAMHTDVMRRAAFDFIDRNDNPSYAPSMSKLLESSWSAFKTANRQDIESNARRVAEMGPEIKADEEAEAERIERAQIEKDMYPDVVTDATPTQQLRNDATLIRLAQGGDLRPSRDLINEIDKKRQESHERVLKNFRKGIKDKIQKAGFLDINKKDIEALGKIYEGSSTTREKLNHILDNRLKTLQEKIAEVSDEGKANIPFNIGMITMLEGIAEVDEESKIQSILEGWTSGITWKGGKIKEILKRTEKKGSPKESE
jgi:hypothetical protein